MKWLHNLIPGRRKKLQKQYDEINNEIIYIKSKLKRLRERLSEIDGRTKQAKSISEIMEIERNALTLREQELKELSQKL